MRAHHPGEGQGPRPSITEHLERVLSLAHPRVEREVPLDAAAGLVLASDVSAALAVPPFDNSAVDGFAVHASDLPAPGPWTLPVAGDVPAGSPALACPAGHAIRVMTGAPVDGADSDLIVVPVEQTSIPRGPHPLPQHVTINEADTSRSHIRRAGENVRPGTRIASRGTLCDAPTLAACVSTGIRTVDVFAAPRIAVVSTGSELVPWPGAVSGPQIPDSNLPMLAELAAAATGHRGTVQRFHANDAATDAADLLARAAASSDLVITSGGVSAGAFDVVRAVAEDEASGSMWFGHVAQRPGSPQGAGTFRGTPMVCLPGNPVAAYVSFVLYAAPLIAAHAGRTDRLRLAERPRVVAERAPGFPSTSRPDTTFAVPVRLRYDGDRAVAEPFSAATSSSFVASLAGVDGLAVVDKHSGPVHVYL